MTEKQKFIRLIFRELKRIDPRWNPADESFRAGMVLLASVGFGKDIPTLAGATALPESFVRLVLRRATKAGIWRGNHLRVNWLNERLGNLSVVLDALVVGGEITRSPSQQTIDQRNARRTQRIAAGRCSNCGGERTTEQKVCARCRQSMKASRLRRQASTQGGDVLLKPRRDRDDCYIHNNFASQGLNTKSMRP